MPFALKSNTKLGVAQKDRLNQLAREIVAQTGNRLALAQAVSPEQTNRDSKFLMRGQLILLGLTEWGEKMAPAPELPGRQYAWSEVVDRTTTDAGCRALLHEWEAARIG